MKMVKMANAIDSDMMIDIGGPEVGSVDTMMMPGGMINYDESESKGLSSAAVLTIVVVVCVILGVILGIFSGKRNANK